MRKFDQEQSAFGYALLLYIVIVVVLITLIPFEFRIPDKIQFSWETYPEDFFANIILFLPVGFIFKLSRRANQDRFCINALIFGTLLSVAIEFAQLFVPGRYTSIIDVITNGSGAWLGGLIFVFLKQTLKEERAGRLPTLELPLMNLVYLLIPLMWLTGLSAGPEVLRWWLMVLLGLFGGGVLFSIYFYRLRGGGTVGPNKLSCFAMGWFYIGALPMLTGYPLRVIFFGAGLGAVSQLLARVLKAGNRTERRFELPTLKRLFPLYLIYLLLVAAWPTTVPLNEWQVFIDFKALTAGERIVFTFRFVELIAAFTLWGYMIAEMRGRKNEAAGKTFAWVLITALVASVVVIMLKGLPASIFFSLIETGLASAASLYGAVIYRVQLAAIRGSNIRFFS
ncbi:VanZ family protein [Thermodesulfobacteriota bacterium]